MKTRPVVIAIDGPSGSGKSSTSKGIALRANYEYLDTGALYRAATIIASENQLSNGNEIVAELKKHNIFFSRDPKNPITKIDNRDVSQHIRVKQVTDEVSRVSAYPEVRAYLIELQRKYIEMSTNGIVVEGRDIGTIVAPQADCKIFLVADIEARSIRREAELKEMQLLELEQSVAEDLQKRDNLDSSRLVSPLKQANDAIVVDSTFLNLEETIEYIWNILKQKSLLGIPTVVVLGRPNVGKSTLVNRFLGSREAIIENAPGITRDRVRYEVEWNGKRFVLIDTGGWIPSGEGIELKIAQAAAGSLAEADLVLLVVDAKVGAQTEDLALVELLRKSGKEILLIGNKVDSERDEVEAHALWNLGLGQPHFVSAAHGRNSGDLLDVVVSKLPEVGRNRTFDSSRRIAIVGRPNVGKSALLNALAGEEIALVSGIAGTTRDVNSAEIKYKNKLIDFYDTAGLRRRGKISAGIEFFSATRTKSAIEKADVCLVLIDATEGLSKQDEHIVGMVKDANKALIVAVSKWDALEDKEENSMAQMSNHISANLQ